MESPRVYIMAGLANCKLQIVFNGGAFMCASQVAAVSKCLYIQFLVVSPLSGGH